MDELHPDIEAALAEVLAGNADDQDAELHQRLRALIRNCIDDNYDQTDVRAVIELAIEPAGDD
jgi:hypothetical protein